MPVASSSRPRTSRTTPTQSPSAATSTIADLSAQFNKRYGPGTLVRASEMRALDRVSSGSLAFDVMLKGGWVKNQWSEIIGEPSHGKTALIMKTVATNQALDPDYEVVWVASERYVPEWAAAIGVDNTRVQLVNTNVMEEAYEVVVEALDKRACDMVVIDSLADLSPSDEGDKTFEDWQVGLGARLTNKFMRKSSTAQRRSLVEEERSCTGLIVNQWRYKIGVMHGDPRTTPNGAQKDFSFFARVEVRRDEWLEYKKRKVGISIKARTMKNKAGPVGRVAALSLYFDKVPGFEPGQFDIAQEIAALAVTEGVVDGAGTPWLKYGDQRWNGVDKFAAQVREDLDLQRELWDAVLTITGAATPPQRPAARKPKLRVTRAS